MFPRIDVDSKSGHAKSIKVKVSQDCFHGQFEFGRPRDREDLSCFRPFGNLPGMRAKQALVRHFPSTGRESLPVSNRPHRNDIAYSIVKDHQRQAPMRIPALSSILSRPRVLTVIFEEAFL